MSDPHSTAKAISTCLGWAYFVAWSISFYPQIILNNRRERVDGLSTEFTILNIIGFGCYTIYTSAFYFSEAIQQEYKQRFSKSSPLVALQDVMFAFHALVLSILLGLQALKYHQTRSALSTLGRISILSILTSVAVFLIVMLIRPSLMWLDLVYLCASIKLLISFIKYIPQALLNYQNKSTIGWAIGNIILDVTGGLLSLGQLITDYWIEQEKHPISSHNWVSSFWKNNPAKMSLALFSFGFEAIFLYQHFILYRPNRSATQNEETSIFVDQIYSYVDDDEF